MKILYNHLIKVIERKMFNSDAEEQVCYDYILEVLSTKDPRNMWISTAQLVNGCHISAEVNDKVVLILEYFNGSVKPITAFFVGKS